MPALTGLPRGATLRLILYIRVSTAREDMISPELQEHTCRKHAAENGATIIDVVYDLDLSGKDFAKRSIGSIIARIANDEANGVLVYRWDRFGRNIELSLANLRALEGIGGVARSATEHFDTATAAGRFARTSMLGVAELQREQIGENWQSAHARRLRNGLPYQGSPRFGYWYCDSCPMPEPRSPRGVRRGHRARQRCEKCKAGIQIPHPVYGPALAHSFEEFASGTPLSRIAHELRLDGLRTYSGNPISDTQLLNAMDTGFGAGYIRITPDAQSWANEELPESAVPFIGVRKIDRFLWVPGAHEAVINESTWEAFLERRKGRPRRASHKTRAKYPASGLVVCIDCDNGKGAPMKAGSSQGAGGGKYLTWRCSNIAAGACNHSNASREAVDKVIFDWLVRHAKGEDAASAVAEQVAAQTKDDPGKSAKVESEIEHLKKQKKNLVRMRASDEIDQVEFIEQRDDIAQEISEAQARLARINKPISAPKRKVFQGLLKEWAHMDDDAKRAALKKVIGRIEASRGNYHDEGRYKIIPRWEMPA